MKNKLVTWRQDRQQERRWFESLCSNLELSTKGIFMRELESGQFHSFIERNELAVVDFWAPWCGPCRALEPVLTELAEEMTSYAFAKLNADYATEIALELGIMGLPTIFVSHRGAWTKLIHAPRAEKSWLKRKLTDYGT